MATMLREYETVFVLHPDLTDDIVTSTVDRLKEVITKMGGEILNEDHWGKKKLAFAVKKHQRGNYVLFHYVAPVGVVEDAAFPKQGVAVQVDDSQRRVQRLGAFAHRWERLAVDLVGAALDDAGGECKEGECREGNDEQKCDQPAAHV